MLLFHCQPQTRAVPVRTSWKGRVMPALGCVRIEATTQEPPWCPIPKQLGWGHTFHCVLSRTRRISQVAISPRFWFSRRRCQRVGSSRGLTLLALKCPALAGTQRWGAEPLPSVLAVPWQLGAAGTVAQGHSRARWLWAAAGQELEQGGSAPTSCPESVVAGLGKGVIK